MPLTVLLGRARGARVFCALSAHRSARLLAVRSIIPDDPVVSAALEALPPPAGYGLLADGTASDGPGAAEAAVLAALAARLGRRAGAGLDEERLLAAALGGLILIHPGVDAPAAERIRPPRRARLGWWAGPGPSGRRRPHRLAAEPGAGRGAYRPGAGRARGRGRAAGRLAGGAPTPAPGG